MSGHESGFRQAVVKSLRLSGYFCQPVESGSTARGIPDLYIAPDIWVELKAETETAWPSTKKVAFRPLQLSWMLKAELFGASCFVLTKFGNRIVAFRSWMFDKEDPRYFIDMDGYSRTHFDAKEFVEWTKRR